MGARAAAVVLLVGLAALVVFHLLVIAGVVPKDVVWGGRAQSEVMSMELAALAATLVFMIIVVVWIRSQPGAVRRIARVGIWVMFVFFLVNVLGNMVSKSSLERAVFTPLSIVLALASLRVGLGDGKDGGKGGA